MTLTTDATGPEPDAATARRVLQRFVLPADRDLDVVPLYVDTEAAVLDADKGSIGASNVAKNMNRAALRQSISTGTGLHPDAILGRHRLRVDDGDRISTGTYFNGFAASYWRRWTVVQEVTLEITVAGAGDGDLERHLLHDRPAPPVAGGEAVEVGASGDPVPVVDPKAVTAEDGVGVQAGAGGDRLAQGRAVHVLGDVAGTDRALVRVEHGGLGVDVQRHHVEVTVGRQHEALQHPARGRCVGLGAGCVGRERHSSTPPDFSWAPSEKCGFSLPSYIASAEPIAMCMSRYL